MVDPDNVQGNILAGFNTDHQTFLGFRAHDDTDLDDLRSWLAELADDVTSTTRVRAERSLIRDPTTSQGRTWLFLALGQSLMRRLRPDAVFASQAFRNGFTSRASSVMGDASDPATWAVGGPDTAVDLLLIVAGNHDASDTEQADLLARRAVNIGLTQSYRERGLRIDGDKEHFGFKDGISQPTIDVGDGSGGTPPGQFLAGHPDLEGRTRKILVSGPAELAADGSFMVFRRLSQDVAAFRAFCEAERQRLTPQWPGVSAEHLAALIVGRWPEGQLVSAQTSAPDGPSQPDNGFDFSDDHRGEHCPFAAHIRKVNPRKGGSDVARPERHRFLRRGIPFGVTYDERPNEERGLLFVAFQSSIHDQVDFVTRNWMNSLITPNPGGDLLVGRSQQPREATLTVLRDGNSIKITTTGNAWVIPTGGAYLFAPGLRGLRLLGSPPRGMLWRARARLGKVQNLVLDALVGDRP